MEATSNPLLPFSIACKLSFTCREEKRDVKYGYSNYIIQAKLWYPTCLKDNLNYFFKNCGWSTSSSLFPSSYLKISYMLKATINAQFESKGSLLKIVLPREWKPPPTPCFHSPLLHLLRRSPPPPPPPPPH